jgi:hypothetical protein
MRGAIPSLPQYAFMVWCLVKHRDNFTFTFTSKTSEFCIRSDSQRSVSGGALLSTGFMVLTRQ